MRVFLLDGTYAGTATYRLKKRDRVYLFRSLRLSAGDLFTARDNDGCYYEARIIDEDTISLTPVSRPDRSLTDTLSGFRGKIAPVCVYQGLCKGKKNEDIARMLTEAGVLSITFFTSEYTQEKELNRHAAQRIMTIMKEAVQQSGSETAVRDVRVIPFTQAVMEAEGRKIILHQSSLEESRYLSDILKDIEKGSLISLFIGSEGGFSESECSFAVHNGASAAIMPTNILRAETAGIFALGAIENSLYS